jgi:hypothetical protein
VAVQQIVLVNPSSISGNITGLTLSVSGTGNPSAITGVTLLKNGTPIASTTFSGSMATFNITDPLPGSSSVTYTMMVNFGAGASGTYQFSISGATGGYGSAIGYLYQFSGIPVPGATVAIASATPTSTWTPTASATASSDKPVIYPNPSDGTQPVTVQVALAQATDTVQLQVFTLAFRSVQDVTVTSLSPNVTASTLTGVSAKTWKIQIPALDKWGSPLASGLYYVVITANGKKTIGKMLILR